MICNSLVTTDKSIPTYDFIIFVTLIISGSLLGLQNVLLWLKYTINLKWIYTLFKLIFPNLRIFACTSFAFEPFLILVNWFSRRLPTVESKRNEAPRVQRSQNKQKTINHLSPKAALHVPVLFFFCSYYSISAAGEDLSSRHLVCFMLSSALVWLQKEHGGTKLNI